MLRFHVVDSSVRPVACNLAVETVYTSIRRESTNCLTKLVRSQEANILFVLNVEMKNQGEMEQATLNIVYPHILTSSTSFFHTKQPKKQSIILITEINTDFQYEGIVF